MIFKLKVFILLIQLCYNYSIQTNKLHSRGYMNDQEYDSPDVINMDDDVNELIYDTFSNRFGEDLIIKFKEMIAEPRWNFGEEVSYGYYREGGAQMLRYIINTYEQQKALHNSQG